MDQPALPEGGGAEPAGAAGADAGASAGEQGVAAAAAAAVPAVTAAAAAAAAAAGEEQEEEKEEEVVDALAAAEAAAAEAEAEAEAAAADAEMAAEAAAAAVEAEALRLAQEAAAAVQERRAARLAAMSMETRPEAVAHAGWLLKRGHLVRNWKRRWCVLEDGVLSYHASEADATKGAAKGALSLLGTEMRCARQPQEETEELPVVFRLTVGGHCDKAPPKHLLMCAPSLDEMEVWQEAFRASWVGPDGDTVAMRAARDGEEQELRMFLLMGLDCNLQSNSGITAVMQAAAGGHLGCLECLLTFGAELDTQSLSGNTALMSAVREEEPESLAWLVRHGADMTTRADDGSSALSLAVQGSRTQDLKVLLDGGADVDAVDDRGWTPIMVAARSNNTPMMETLIAARCDINFAQPSTGISAVMLAVQEGQNEALRLLVEHGVDLSHRTNLNKSVLDFANAAQNEEAMGMLSTGLCAWTRQPEPEQVIVLGKGFSLTAEAKGDPAPSFKWRKDGTVIDPDADPNVRITMSKSDATGVGTTTLTLLSTDASSEGLFVCLGINKTGMVRSELASVELAKVPAFTAHPQSVTEDPGNKSALKVEAASTPPAEFAWFKDGQPLTGGEGTGVHFEGGSLVFEELRQSDAGKYTAVAHNMAGQCTSKEATVTVSGGRLAHRRHRRVCRRRRRRRRRRCRRRRRRRRCCRCCCPCPCPCPSPAGQPPYLPLRLAPFFFCTTPLAGKQATNGGEPPHHGRGEGAAQGGPHRGHPGAETAVV